MSLTETLSENRIDKEIKRLDNLIMWDYKDSPNVKQLLMEIRNALSWYWKIDWYDFYGEELQDMLFFLEKQETWILTPQDYLEWAYNSFNYLRKSLSVETKLISSAVKDMTSNKLFIFWRENSSVEQFLEDNIGDPLILDFSKSLPAWLAWWIDASLDYLTAFVDVNVVIDEVYQTTKELF